MRHLCIIMLSTAFREKHSGLCTKAAAGTEEGPKGLTFGAFHNVLDVSSTDQYELRASQKDCRKFKNDLFPKKQSENQV